MKREIKFRFWNTAAQTMQTDSTGWNENMGINEMVESMNDYEIIPQQFTGRIDLNGKEIYEGDIVKVPYGKGKVEYASNQGMFIITWIDDREANNEALAYEPNSYKYGRTRKDLEVIGNIFETPELLTVGGEKK